MNLVSSENLVSSILVTAAINPDILGDDELELEDPTTLEEALAAINNNDINNNDLSINE